MSIKLYFIGLGIFLIISFVLARWLGKEKGFDTVIACTVLIWLIFFFCSLGLECFLNFFRETQEIENFEIKRLEIVALNNYSAIKGDFFLAQGNINSIPSYVYYYKTHDGGIRLDTIDARNINIYEQDSDEAYLSLVGTKVIYTDKPNNTLLQLFVPVFRMSDEEVRNRHWTIHVPKGTIIRQVQLDLQHFN